MPANPPIYGFDLLTDTLGDCVDPTVNTIRSVALDTGRGVEVLDGDERTILSDLDALLATLAPGVIVTWNGSLLDLPLMVERATTTGVTLDLVIRADRRAAPVSPIVDLDHAVCGAWGPHQHLDLRRVYAAVSRWRKRGRLDPESLIPPADDLAQRDPAKDASLARRLAERRWGQARKYVDRMPERAGTPLTGGSMTAPTSPFAPPMEATSGHTAPQQHAVHDMGQTHRRRRSDR